jgi:hypothetical protein
MPDNSRLGRLTAKPSPGSKGPAASRLEGGSPDATPPPRGPRADALLTPWPLLCTTMVAVLLLFWRVIFPLNPDIPLSSVVHAEPAVLKIQKMRLGTEFRTPNWEELFNAYQLETSLRDVSIRKFYNLDDGTNIRGYLKHGLTEGATVKIYLLDPGNEADAAEPVQN